MRLATAYTGVRRGIEAAVRRYVADNDLLPPDGSLLVAVSGGPDSTALLLVLTRLARRDGLQLCVAYFDHGLRGAETAEQEERFVRGLAESHGLPFFSGRGDVRQRARGQHLSLEDAARRERYEFLATAAQETGCSAVATGHTASDQAETVLLHLVRGAGLAGLGGMAPRSPWPFSGRPDLTLIRPLLCLSRQDTAAYCDAAGVAPLEDETNRSPAYVRNRIRHELLPLLRTYNPRIEASLVRLAEAARLDVEFLESLASEAVIQEGGEISIARAIFSVLHASPRRHALRLALQTAAGDGQGFSERHLHALERLGLEGQTGDSLDLPRGVRAELTREALTIRAAAEQGLRLPDVAVSLPVPGEVCFGPLIVAASTDEAVDGDTVSAELDAAAVGDTVCVRRRRNGDRFQPSGMQATKKLQDFFVDEHVARSERDLVPVFENERGIVWVGGLRVAEWARPKAGRPTVRLSYRRA